jgi:hypothetical protein
MRPSCTGVAPIFADNVDKPQSVRPAHTQTRVIVGDRSLARFHIAAENEQIPPKTVFGAGGESPVDLLPAGLSAARASTAPGAIDLLRGESAAPPRS